MEADIPLGWKPLNLERYHGITDPIEHLDAFLTQENLYTNDDAIMCRAFPTSLKGVALTCRSHRMTLVALASLQEADDESLRKFMDRFGHIVQIHNLNPESHKHQLHAIWDIDINYVDTPSPQSLPSITFMDRDFKGINPINQDDPMVVSIIIDNFMVSKVLID
ncbi:hypothetical protein HKD37_10G028732 [Glycine soja]